MLLAELEVFHSRPFSPTRRLALGRCRLPVDPAPGFGPLLLGATVAVAAEALDVEDQSALLHLMHQLREGQRVVQPRLRNRYQTDHQGLARSGARLLGGGEALELDLDGHGSPLQMALAATYAAAALPLSARPRAYDVLRKGLAWRGPIGPALFTELSGRGGVPAWTAGGLDPTSWALELLGLKNGHQPSTKEIQKRFRQRLREAHPDHGGEAEGAADRIQQLTEARRILLG